MCFIPLKLEEYIKEEGFIKLENIKELEQIPNSVTAYSNAVVSGASAFIAGTLVGLKPGFHAMNGSNFTASYGGVVNVASRYYYLKDHLGSIRMTVDGTGTVVGYDDYYPYGMTMPGRSQEPSVEDARYKFIPLAGQADKERDAEENLDYFGARYYDSWKGQWAQVDPMQNLTPSLSPYNYYSNNPIAIIDKYGLDTSQRAIRICRKIELFNEKSD